MQAPFHPIPTRPFRLFPLIPNQTCGDALGPASHGKAILTSMISEKLACVLTQSGTYARTHARTGNPTHERTLSLPHSLTHLLTHSFPPSLTRFLSNCHYETVRWLRGSHGLIIEECELDLERVP
jgi:hypothetical protein